MELRMMTLSRRRMFGFLAAAPVAAKAAAQEAAAGLAGMQVGGLVDARNFQAVLDSSCSMPGGIPLQPVSSAIMRAVGIPDWIKRLWQEQARHVNQIDPDIAALQSTSLAGKIAAQRARNYQTIEERFWRGLSWEDARSEADAWRKKTGVGLWG